MLNTAPHNRFHIPNGLAILAAVILLLSSAVSENTDSDIQASGTDSMASGQIESTDDRKLNDTAGHKRRGIKLGHLLFRR